MGSVEKSCEASHRQIGGVSTFRCLDTVVQFARDLAGVISVESARLNVCYLYVPSTHSFKVFVYFVLQIVKHRFQTLRPYICKEHFHLIPFLVENRLKKESSVLTPVGVGGCVLARCLCTP